MQLNSFGANKYQTINSTRSQLIKPTKRSIFSKKVQHQSSNYIVKAKSKIQFILQDSPHESSKRYYSQDQNKLMFETKDSSINERMHNHITYSQRTSLNKNQNKISPIQQKMRLKILYQLKKKREKFLSQYGYVKNRRENSLNEKLQTINITSNLNESGERICLNFIQEQQIKKCQQNQLKNPKTFSMMSSKKKRRFNKSVNDAEKQLDQRKDKNQSASDLVLRSKKILQTVDDKNLGQSINMKQLVKSLLVCSNRIYGKKHQSDSVIWCNDVLAAKVQQKTQPFFQQSQLKQQKKRRIKQKSSIAKTTKILQGLRFKSIEQFDTHR